MGQYYMGVIGTEDSTRTAFTPAAWAYSHDHDEGLKLMEHSWLDAALPRTIMVALLDTPRRVVWAGDYADPEPGTVTAGRQYGITLYQVSHEDEAPKGWQSAVKLKPTVETAPRFIVNHDKWLYVNLTHCPSHTYYWTGGKAYTVHPLPLLTAEGNGRGGGDFRGGQGEKHIGTWARDLISTSFEEPGVEFSEFRPDFIED